MGNKRFIDREPFPNFFRAWREHRGMTQAQVEQLYNWPVSRVSNLEHGRATITSHVLVALARAYGCEVADLISRDPNAEPAPSRAVLVTVGDGLGFAGLHDALTALGRLGEQVVSMRGELTSRLDHLEQEIASAAQNINETLRDGVALADTFERAAGQLRATVTPAGSDTVADG